MNKHFLRTGLSLVSVSVSAFGLIGCTFNKADHDTSGFNLSQLETIVKVNESTVDDVRAIFSKPDISATLMDGSTVYGYMFEGDDLLSTGENLLTQAVTFTLAYQTNYTTIKNAFFKFDKNGKVVEIKKNGYAFLNHYKGTRDKPDLYFAWNRCEVVLTDAEVNSDINYFGRSDICPRYQKEVAARDGVAPESVDTDKKFFFCDPKCHLKRGLGKAFGQYKDFTFDVRIKDGDRSRMDEMLILHVGQNKKPTSPAM